MNNGETPTNDLLSAYHDGEVNAAEREVVERMLAESADARAELEDYARITAELRNLPDGAPSIDVSGAVLANIRRPTAHPVSDPAARKGRHSWRSLLPLGIAGAIAACVLVAIGVRMSLDTDPLGMPVAGTARRDAPDSQAADFAMDTESAAEEMTMSRPMADHGTTSAAPPAAASMDAEGGLGYFSGESAQPPPGIGVGKMYSYLERTKEGDIVVVEAYVVDVRQAVDQIQVLLARNQIPTATVSELTGAGLDLARAQPRNDLAVYVESDPSRVKVVLEDLRRQIGTPSNSIQGMQVAGVLDTAGSESDHWRFNNQELNSFIPPHNPEGDLELDAHAPEAGTSIPDVSPTEDDEETMSTFSAPIGPDAASTPEEAATAKAMNEPPAESVAPVFQTVLNVSNSAISQELRRQQRTLPEERRLSEQEHAKPEAAEAAGSFIEIPGAVQRFQGTERRLRLLLVLQQRPEPGAVEAPRPSPVQSHGN